jgi:outer membrane protein OmpA-like peptidoglycan-associated protein
VPNSDTLTFTGPRILTIETITSPINSLTTANAGVTWQHSNGFFIGGGIGWNLEMKGREAFGADSDPNSLLDFADWQVRIGFHPGVRVYVPPPPPAPTPVTQPPVSAPEPSADCPGPVRAVHGRERTGGNSDGGRERSDGDTVTYRWTAPSGTLQNPGDRQTAWVAPQQEGPVQVTVTVNDGKGGTASAVTTIQVVRPTLVELVFEDVYFDFDRSALRTEALRLLERHREAAGESRRNDRHRGHTRNIGTAEYNLALGDRRAERARLPGVARHRGKPSRNPWRRAAERQRPRETRRLNRRAALVVRVQ